MRCSGNQTQVLRASKASNLSSCLLPHLEAAPSSHPAPTPSTVPLEDTYFRLREAAVFKGFTVTGTIEHGIWSRTGLGWGCRCSVVWGIGEKPSSMKS